MSDTSGALVIIGGHEDKEGDRPILREVAKRLNGGRLVVATVASHKPDGAFEAYRAAFAPLGVTDLSELYVNQRSEAFAGPLAAMMTSAAGVFFTGGDQLRITGQIGNTPVEHAVRALHRRGGVIAGTSAGASVMSETMMVGGSGAESHRIGDLHMAPGLGLIRDVIIDQHFAERGRFGRLLGAVASDPRALGIGLDEDTAIVVEARRFGVIGGGGVMIVDGSTITHSNVDKACPDQTLSMHDVRLHALSAGDVYDLEQRRPVTS